ncbi:MAG: DinB family protein [Candidatus Rokubacteria bacterium]|nr:DinB family protein [Candidatus Rokubacteria bacterium]
MARAPKRCPLCRGPHTLLRESPVKVLGRTARALTGVVRRTRRRLLTRRPKPGEWSATEVLAHLADVELAWGFRIRKIVSEPRPVLTAFDQEAWARALRYPRLDPRALFDTFRAVRDSNLRILRSLAPARRRRVGVHSEAGPIRLDQLVAHLAEHDLNHLNQIRTTLRSLSGRR